MRIWVFFSTSHSRGQNPHNKESQADGFGGASLSLGTFTPLVGEARLGSHPEISGLALHRSGCAEDERESHSLGGGVSGPALRRGPAGLVSTRAPFCAFVHGLRTSRPPGSPRDKCAAAHGAFVQPLLYGVFVQNLPAAQSDGRRVLSPRIPARPARILDCAQG